MWLVAAAVPAVVLLAACGGSEEVVENLIESSGGGDVEVDFDDDTVNMTITDEEGNEIVIGSGADIPAGFPLPVPSGATVLASVDTPNETGLNLQYSGDAYDSVVAEYGAWVAAQGLDDVQTNTTDASGLKSMQWFSPTGGFFVAVTQAQGMTAVTISLTK
jgi:hypothetical protein